MRRERCAEKRATSWYYETATSRWRAFRMMESREDGHVGGPGASGGLATGVAASRPF